MCRYSHLLHGAGDPAGRAGGRAAGRAGGGDWSGRGRGAAPGRGRGGVAPAAVTPCRVNRSVYGCYIRLVSDVCLNNVA